MSSAAVVHQRGDAEPGVDREPGRHEVQEQPLPSREVGEQRQISAARDDDEPHRAAHIAAHLLLREIRRAESPIGPVVDRPGPHRPGAHARVEKPVTPRHAAVDRLPRSVASRCRVPGCWRARGASCARGATSGTDRAAAAARGARSRSSTDGSGRTSRGRSHGRRSADPTHPVRRRRRAARPDTTDRAWPSRRWPRRTECS